MVPFEKFNLVSYNSTVIKKIVVFPFCSRFPVELSGCTAFGSESSACCLRKSIAISL